MGSARSFKLPSFADKCLQILPSLAGRNLPVILTSALQVLAEHFFQTGQLAVASAFAEEAGISGAEEMRTRFGEMHAIIHEVDSPLFNLLQGRCSMRLHSTEPSP